MPAITAGITAGAALTSCTAPAEPLPTNAVTAPTAENRPGISTPAFGADYVDGEYSAEGQYGSQPSSIGVTVILSDDTITDVSVTPHATDPTSMDLQQRFAAAVPAVVRGRDIDDVKIDRLAGSSGTPQGFNAALERIKDQAAQ